MKLFPIIVVALASLTTQAQNKKTSPKILIGYSFSPDYSTRTLKNGDGNSSTDLIIKSRNDIEIPKFGFTTGLNVYFKFFDFAGFETGVQYSNKGYKTKNQDLVYFPPNSSAPQKARSIYNYQYIGIPLKAKFDFGHSKTRFTPSAGFITSFLLNQNQKSVYEYSDGRTEKKSQSKRSNFNKIDLSPIVSIGIDYRLNSKIHLMAEPTCRYGVIKTIDAPVVEHLWSVGFNVGCYYKLR